MIETQYEELATSENPFASPVGFVPNNFVTRQPVQEEEEPSLELHILIRIFTPFIVLFALFSFSFLFYAMLFAEID